MGGEDWLREVQTSDVSISRWKLMYSLLLYSPQGYTIMLLTKGFLRQNK